MMSPEEFLNACVGDLYRYRLAVQDQLPRVEAATQALRSKRDSIGLSGLEELRDLAAGEGRLP
jgi:hypothetical protein